MKTVNLPGGYDYLATTRQGATCVPADMSQFQTLVNSAAWRTLTGTQQDDINQVDQLASMTVDNALRIPYEIPRLKSIAQQYSSTLNTLAPAHGTQASINTVQETWTDTTTDTWTMWAEVDDNAPALGPGGVERLAVWNLNLTANSTFSSSIAPFIQGATGLPTVRWLHAMYVLAASGTLANGEFRITRGMQSEIMADRLLPLNNRILTDYGIRALPAAYAISAGGLVFDTAETGIAEMIDTMMEAPAGTPSNSPGLVTREGKQIMPWSNFDIRFSPTASAAASVIIRSYGYVA